MYIIKHIPLVEHDPKEIESNSFALAKGMPNHGNLDPDTKPGR
jgi:hypothetical protein